MNTPIPKSKFLDVAGRPLTQSIFLEIGYSDYAVYTLKDDDHEYKGVVYPSLKKLYLAEQDPTEYNFATKHLLNWKQWQRLVDNKLVRKEIDEWRDELAMKLQAEAVIQIMGQARKGKVVASKWLADRGWDTRGAGRPSKAEKDAFKKVNENIESEYTADILQFKQQQGL